MKMLHFAQQSFNLFYLFNYDQKLVSNNTAIKNILSKGNYIIMDDQNTANYGDYMEAWFGQNIWTDYDQNIEINYSLNYAKYVWFSYYLSPTKDDDEQYEFIDSLGQYLFNQTKNPLFQILISQ